MAKLQDFINKWQGRNLDTDGFPAGQPYQCVDVAKAWNKELGYPPVYGNGRDYINNSGTSYTRINYTPGAFPIEGDIVSWGAMPGNEFGHVAVAVSGNAGGFTSFDQNWGKTAAVCQKINHNYNYVLGWIRPKNYQSGGDEPMVNDADNEYGRWNKLFVQIRGRNATRDEFRAAAVGRSWLSAMEILSDNPEADRNIESANVGRTAQSQDWAGQIATLRTQVGTITTQLNGANDMIKRLQSTLDAQNSQITELEQKLKEALNQPVPVPPASQTPAPTLQEFLQGLIDYLKKFFK